MVPLERAAERELRFVSDSRSNFGEARVGVAQELGGEQHALPREIAQRRDPCDGFETAREGGAREADGARELLHRPALRRIFLHEGHRLQNAAVGDARPRDVALVGRDGAREVGGETLRYRAHPDVGWDSLAVDSNLHRSLRQKDQLDPMKRLRHGLSIQPR